MHQGYNLVIFITKSQYQENLFSNNTTGKFMVTYLILVNIS